MESIQLGDHVIDLGDAEAVFLDGVAQYIYDLAYAAKRLKILLVTLSILIGAAIVGMQPHDEAREV